jgi:hypothetical protein
LALENRQREKSLSPGFTAPLQLRNDLIERHGCMLGRMPRQRQPFLMSGTISRLSGYEALAGLLGQRLQWLAESED